jgi:hypothetical protein
MEVTEFEIMIDDNGKHPRKQWFPTEITEVGRDNDEHPTKQLFPIDVTEIGIAMDVNDRHSWKQWFQWEQLYLGWLLTEDYCILENIDLIGKWFFLKCWMIEFLCLKFKSWSLKTYDSSDILIIIDDMSLVGRWAGWIDEKWFESKNQEKVEFTSFFVNSMKYFL